MTSSAQVERLIADGSTLLRQNKVDDARERFEQATAIDGQNTRAYGLLGLCLFRQGDYQAASQLYERLIVEHPKDASFRMNMGLVQLKLGRAPAAIAALTKARQLDPSMKRVSQYLGLAYARSGNYAEAYRSFLIAGKNDLAQEMRRHLNDAAVSEIHRQIEQGEEGLGAPAAGTSPPQAQQAARHITPPVRHSSVDDSGTADSDGIPIVESSGNSSADHGDFSARGPITRAVDAVVPLGHSELVARQAARKVPVEASRSPGAKQPRHSEEHVAMTGLESLAECIDNNQHETATGSSDTFHQLAVHGEAFVRGDWLVASSGQLTFSVLRRTVQGVEMSEAVGGTDHPMLRLAGDGVAIMPSELRVMDLDGLDLFVVENMLAGFDGNLFWDCGDLPGSAKQNHVVRLRGEGFVALAVKDMHVVAVTPDEPCFCDSRALLGWTGKVFPQIVKSNISELESAKLVECTGEGAILVRLNRE